ncbi:hypothetical protein TNIN_44501 [Trichonephila inaurata madagascariensis]|uniref:Uncharacterized protein n=1 Tax=Trichonephila inaurata madagascariensis TaxID=2747483 RepID=A0A8X6WPU7_9ARAC|nr:hypothetical protein TNIN_44501 [Trichonephila inaurata madagascariensis]
MDVVFLGYQVKCPDWEQLYTILLQQGAALRRRPYLYPLLMDSLPRKVLRTFQTGSYWKAEKFKNPYNIASDAKTTPLYLELTFRIAGIVLNERTAGLL